MAVGEHPLSLHVFFSLGQTKPLFLAATLEAMEWLPRVDLLPSWLDLSSGLWACGEAACGQLGVGASLGGHGASAAPSSLPLFSSGGGHGTAVEAGACAVGSGGVAGGKAGGWQPGRPGGLGRSPLPPCSASAVALASVVVGGRECGRRWVAASSATDLAAAVGACMVGDGTVGGGTLLQLSCTCMVEAVQLMADVGWLSDLWRRRR
jgi:hypothetical protein